MKHYFKLIALTVIWAGVSAFAGCSSAQSTTSNNAVKETSLHLSESAPSALIAKDGKALMPIVISAEASDKTKELSQTLAEYLQKISGAEFTIVTSAKVLSSATSGIAIGTITEFPGLINKFDPEDPTKTEDYLLQSHKEGLTLVGASDLGLRHAAWDFLYRLGYRQFFPGKNWEIIPQTKNLSIAVNIFERPDYYSRSIWPGFGDLEINSADWADWNRRNRMGAGIRLSTGHAYGNIIRHNKAEFEKHPEYLTKPGGNKFCASNPGLQKLVIDDALTKFSKNPNLQSVSMDPSDGGNWESDSCPDATVYNSVTDRAVTLANLVAQAVNKQYRGKFVGMYAYNDHSPPPTIDVDEHVIPSIATSFIRGGYTLDELIDGWSKKAQRLGIREYYSVNTWDRDLPGRARGANLNYLVRTIPHFYDKGARFLTAESSDNWGSNGLGYYIASQLLWNTDNAKNVDAIKADFFEKAFGPAQEPMAEFYTLIDGSNKPLLSDDLRGRMYRQLDAALKLTDDPAIRARINDLALYARYVELYSEYSRSGGEARQAAFETLMRYTWRIRDTQMVHTLAVWRDLAYRDKKVKFSEGTGYRAPEAKNPWKSSEPFTPVQIQTFITDGIANNELLDFTPVSFSDELVPATALQLTSDKRGSFNMLRGTTDLYTWIDKAPATIDLQVQGGLIYRDRGAAKLELFPVTETGGNSVFVGEALPDRQPHSVQLKSTFDGLQRIQLSDGSAGTAVSWDPETPMTIESGIDRAPHFAGGRWTMYFYVPKGTTVLGGYGGRGTILDSDGKKVWDFSKGGYWSVPVPPGQDGKLWKLNSMSGAVKLMTVPPYIARSADELLLPKEVVEADAVK